MSDTELEAGNVEKLDLRSHDVAEDPRQALLRLIPDIRTESGRLDVDRLGTQDFLKLRATESDKVRCGMKHFEALSTARGCCQRGRSVSKVDSAGALFG